MITLNLLYRAFNAIYSKSKAAKSELVSVELFKDYWLPVILYAVESSGPNKQDIRALDNYINLAILKIFVVSMASNVAKITDKLSLRDLGDVIHDRTLAFI